MAATPTTDWIDNFFFSYVQMDNLRLWLEKQKSRVH